MGTASVWESRTTRATSFGGATLDDPAVNPAGKGMVHGDEAGNIGKTTSSKFSVEMGQIKNSSDRMDTDNQWASTRVTIHRHELRVFAASATRFRA